MTAPGGPLRCTLAHSTSAASCSKQKQADANIEPLSRRGVDLLKTFLDREVRNHEDLDETWPRIVAAKDRFSIAISNRTQIGSEIGFSFEDRCNCRREIRRHAYPPDTRSGAGCRNRKAELISIEHVAEIDASRGTEGVITPCAGVHVKQFELAIAWIQLIFQLDQAVVICRT